MRRNMITIPYYTSGPTLEYRVEGCALKRLRRMDDVTINSLAIVHNIYETSNRSDI